MATRSSLAHGITCSLRVWHEQINDLSQDFRVIAYDHRGHGRSGVGRRGATSLQHLAGDLDAVLAATLRPGSARRHRRALDRPIMRDLVLGGPVPAPGRGTRRRRSAADQHHHRRPAAEDQAAAGARHASQWPRAGRQTDDQNLRWGTAFRGAQPGSRRFVAMMAVGAEADPAIADFVHDLFAATPPAGRGRG